MDIIVCGYKGGCTAPETECVAHMSACAHAALQEALVAAGSDPAFLQAAIDIGGVEGFAFSADTQGLLVGAESNHPWDLCAGLVMGVRVPLPPVLPEVSHARVGFNEHIP
jgi:hypothetical protein